MPASKQELDNRQHVTHGGPFEVALGAIRVLFDLSMQLFQRIKPLLVAQTVKETHPNHIAVKITRPIHYESLN